MPAGLTSTLRRDELIDLVRFLSELGKDGQYKVQEDGTMRKWYSSENMNTINTIYTMVSGEIPLDEIAPSTISGQQKIVIFSHFDVSQEGPTTLSFSQADNTRIEIDDKEITPSGGKITQVLSKGKHKVALISSRRPARHRQKSKSLEQMPKQCKRLNFVAALSKRQAPKHIIILAWRLESAATSPDN